MSIHRYLVLRVAVHAQIKSESFMVGLLYEGYVSIPVDASR